MDPEVIPNFLADQRDNASADSQHYFITFEDYWERKLWHELTSTLVEFFNQPGSASQRLPIFNTFIKTFAEKINQLKLVELGLRAAIQCQSKSVCVIACVQRVLISCLDEEERLTFLSELADKVDKPSSQDAYVYARTAVASVRLQKSDADGAKKDLARCEAILDTFDSVETSVHAAFYQVNSDYYQVRHWTSCR